MADRIDVFDGDECTEITTRLPWWINVAMFITLLPILPFFLLKFVAEGLVTFLDWSFEGRPWSRAMIRPANAIEAWGYRRMARKLKPRSKPTRRASHKEG